MFEIWKPVVGYEGFYEVSSRGRIRSLNYQGVPGRVGILKPGKKRNGYLQVTLCDMSGGRKYMNIHRLVATAFLLNNESKETVNHIDENKENNCVENLEWATIKENLMHGTAQERQHKKFRKPVIRFKPNSLYGFKRYPSVTSVKQDGFKQSCVFAVLSGRAKTHSGFCWKYEEAISNG